MLLLLALLQLPPGYPGGRKADPPAPVAQPAPNPTPRGPNSGQGSTGPTNNGPTPRGTATNQDSAQGGEGGKMRGGCKHLLDRSGVNVSVQNTPDGAVLRFQSNDPQKAQQVAQQASACLSKGGRGRDMQNDEGDNRGDNNDGDDRDNGDDHGKGRGRGHGKGHGKDKHDED